MLHRARSSFLLAVVAGAFLPMAPAGAQTLPQQIAQYTFADGTVDGWTRILRCRRRPSYSAAATEDPGTGSLLTTVNYTSSGGGGGPALQLTGLVPGATYTITGYVMLTSGRDRERCELHDAASGPGPLLRWNLLRHPRHLSGADHAHGLGADRRHLYGEHDGDQPAALRAARSRRHTDHAAVFLPR